MGISGILHRHVAYRDRLFSYPAAEEQLLLLESDRLTLQNTVPEIIKYFLELVELPRVYKLFLVDQDEKKIPTTLAAVQEVATKAVRAEICRESHEWTRTGANCWEGKHASKVNPDEIHLCLHLDWDEEKFIFFDAHHL